METIDFAARLNRFEIRSRYDHLDVFREFLDHLDRAARRGKRAAPKRKSTRRKAKS